MPPLSVIVPVKLFVPESVRAPAPESVSPLAVLATLPPSVIGPLVVSSRMVLVAETALLVLMPPESRALSVPPPKEMPPAVLEPSIPVVSVRSVPALIAVAPV